ncbi:MAG: molybdate ABC transporter substrate-binding protein [Methanothrix sp.]|jgi:molybdate transport system substrate-binding protein|nr:molybdate ABC transporter substrate-binding protein [Methanothrix sp.]
MINNNAAYRMYLSLLCSLLFIASAGLAEVQQDLTVYCGAGLTGALSEIGEIYENSSNMSVKFNFDGVPALRAQIEQGAYADVLVSASVKHMKALQSEGFMDNQTVQIFARNKVAIIVPNDNPANITGVKDLADPGVKILMGTKELPAGDYALLVMDNLAADKEFGPAFKDAVLANVVSLETTVNRIVSKVALGEADAGFAFISDVSPQMVGKVTRILIPDKYNVIGDFPVGVLTQSKYPEQSQAFIDVLMSDEGQSILDKYGFIPV